MKRCSKCLLPDSLPGSNFNENGECYWCQTQFPNYTPIGADKFETILKQSKRKGDTADCLVGVSGGKDSSYALFQMKQKFGMKVEAFTYVHDGLTDFALENAKSVCNSLGVKHHLLSLPNHKHLKTFKSFFTAWLASENPLAAAMTCVACKHLHILGTRLAKERKIPMVIWSMCPLEVPPFIPTQPEGGKDKKAKGMLGLSLLLGKSIIKQEGFRKAFLGDIPTCVYGSLAFRPDSGYLKFKYPELRHLYYFDFINWDSSEILSSLKANTEWAVPEHVTNDWHSDCLFNVFKEYMFQKMLGSSYTDAFLSNQIRHGLLTREQAWNELIKSKEFYAKELIKTLSILDMEYLTSQLDMSTFEITN
jgi:hypothetical protein